MNTPNTKYLGYTNAVESYGSAETNRSAQKQKTKASHDIQPYIVKETARMKTNPQPPQQGRRATTTRKSKKTIGAKTECIYKSSPSNPSSYKAKKNKSRSINIEKKILANINECKAKLTQCNKRMKSQQDLAQVPVIMVLRNFLMKMYGDNKNHFLRISLFRWRQHTTLLRQTEYCIKQTAKTIKSMAQGMCDGVCHIAVMPTRYAALMTCYSYELEIVSSSIAAATVKIESMIKDKKNQEAVTGNDATKIQRWYRARSMHKISVDFTFYARGSILCLPNLTKYNSKYSSLKK